MKIHQIKARDLPDLWFQAVNDILDHGERFVIDRGSYAGQNRLEYDYFMGHVNYPATVPLIPDIPPGCGIPNPVEHDYIYGGPGYERAYIEYLMSARKEPGESYTYGERLTRVPLTGDKLVWWEQENAEIVDKRDVDGNIGAWGLARGGMGAISNAIAGALQEHGGEIRTNAGVSQILVKNGKAVGVALKNGDEIYARIIVSNLDAKRTFTKIMDRQDLPPGIFEKAANFRIRGSSGKVNIALSGLPKFTGVPDNRYVNRGGQGFVGSLETMERAYDCWKRGRWSDDPFVESVIPSAWDPTVAPPGQHWMSNFIQYCPPELADGPWTPEKRDQFGRTVIDKIGRYSPGFKDLIVHMEVRTPHEIEAEVGLTEGNIFQGELTIDQLLFNRPFPGYAQYRMPVKNMYMCGSSTHPGGGVSSACGANAAREILRDLKRPNTVPQDDFYDEY